MPQRVRISAAPLAAPFHAVLVANRGEIARRIIRTLRGMGISSVAVYSDADRGARHVAEADLAMRIGPPAPQASYLNIEAIIAAARASGATAIHPGYGFLSENVEFARACAAAGIVFIGPEIEALDIMGDKIRAKNHVAAHGVPVIAGVAEPGLTDEQLIHAAERIGYPLLVKPSAGGGGKGMQVVTAAVDLPAALVTARRIAASAFADDTLFLEQLISAPRHIEVQVLADAHGTVIHLGERECSLQRRHQKVIEEAPSPLLDEVARNRMGEAACEVARSVGYRGAGTVEFLVSAEAPDEFFFMEMNTRLQVEHPVTELVTGIDLVEWQVRIAAGARLTIGQDDVVLSGHAVEARVYAEDPERGFLPSTGTVLALAEAVGDGIRVDSSLCVGLEIPPNYDPMLSKVIAWGENRAQALGRLDSALSDTVVLGVKTNIEYLRMLIADPRVQAGELDTSLIERRLPEFTFRRPDGALLAAAALYLHFGPFPKPGPSPESTSSPEERTFPEERTSPEALEGNSRSPGPLRDGGLAAPQGAVAQGAATQGQTSLWRSRSGWRLGGVHQPSRYAFALSANDRAEVRVLGTSDIATVIVDGIAREASITRFAGQLLIELDDRATRWSIVLGDGRLWLSQYGFSWSLGVLSRADEIAELLASREQISGPISPELRSPMPGTVVAVAVTHGDAVEAGQTVATVEAMKMEHRLIAPVAGTVAISAKVGDVVKLDQLVATITEINPPEQDQRELSPQGKKQEKS